MSLALLCLRKENLGYLFLCLAAEDVFLTNLRFLNKTKHGQCCCIFVGTRLSELSGSVGSTRGCRWAIESWNTSSVSVCRILIRYTGRPVAELYFAEENDSCGNDKRNNRFGIVIDKPWILLNEREVVAYGNAQVTVAVAGLFPGVRRYLR